MKKLLSLGILLPALLLGLAPEPGQAQVGIAVSVNFAPPPLPVYEQPPCPTEGYLWTPGYWAWDPDYGYYWVPGVWVAPPQPGLLWTPGYWGYDNDAYGWHNGYWAPQVGYYGGVDYGWGYGGAGFVGGMWAGNVFRYNTAVVRVNTTVIHNVYVNRTVVRRMEGPRASFNGPGGVNIRPTAREEQVMRGRHFERTSAQMQHITAARSDPQSRFAANHGAPRAAAMARVGQRPVAATNRPSAAEIRAAQAQSRGTHAAANRPGAGGHPAAGENRPMPARNAATRPNENRSPAARPNEARPSRAPQAARPGSPAGAQERAPARSTPQGTPPRPAARVVRPRTETAPRPESRTARTPVPHQESRPAPTPVPHEENRPARTPVPRQESRPAPRVVPQARQAPRTESRPAPRPEERAAPRPEARPAPHPQSRPQNHAAPHPEEKPQ
jgi:hypothetical protein